MGRVITSRIFVVLIIALFAGIPAVHAAELQLQYDANGNLVSGDGKYRVYNSLNQLSAIYNGSDSSGLLLEEYSYHPTEERILKKKVYDNDSTLKETVIYLSPTFVQVINRSGTYNFTYLHHNGQLVAQQVNGTTLFIHGNHEGSSSVVTNASGSVVENTTYAPFGEVVSGGSTVRFGYEGKEHDSLVGDTDFNFRKYKADWGIFTQPDSIIQNVYDPQSLNRYAFERNNPYRYVDPTGHSVQEWKDTIRELANTYIVPLLSDMQQKAATLPLDKALEEVIGKGPAFGVGVGIDVINWVQLGDDSSCEAYHCDIKEPPLRTYGTITDENIKSMVNPVNGQLLYEGLTLSPSQFAILQASGAGTASGYNWHERDSPRPVPGEMQAYVDANGHFDRDAYVAATQYNAELQYAHLRESNLEKYNYKVGKAIDRAYWMAARYSNDVDYVKLNQQQNG